MGDVVVQVRQQPGPGLVHLRRPVGADHLLQGGGHRREEDREDIGGHVVAGVIDHLGLDQGGGVEPVADEIQDGREHLGQHFAADRPVLVAPEQGLHLRMVGEQARIDQRRQVLTTLGGQFQALLDQVGAHGGLPVRRRSSRGLSLSAIT